MKTSKKTSKISPDINLRIQKRRSGEVGQVLGENQLLIEIQSNPSFGRKSITYRNPDFEARSSENFNSRDFH